MSAEEKETFDIMAEQVARINKHMKYAPLYGVLGTLLSGAFALGVFIVKYDISVVKQPQFASFKAQVFKSDSLTNVRIDTTNKRIDDLPKIRFTRVIQRNGKEIMVY